MAPPKDVLLVGFGAVGAIYSLILQRSGQTCVTVVARSNYEAVSKNGMHFQSRKYGDIKGWKPDRLFPSLDGAMDRSYSHVVVTTKAIPEITRTPDLLAPLLSQPYASKYSQPTYVLLQNGLGVERDLYEALKKVDSASEPRIISTANWIGTNLLAPDVVQHNHFDRVQMGVYRPTTTTTSNTPAEEAVLKEFSEMLAAGGSEVSVYPEIQRIKFSKNFWNCVLGSTAALSRLPLNAVFRPPQRDPGASAQSDPAEETSTPPEHLTTSQKAVADILHRSHQIHETTIPLIYDALTEMYNLGVALFPATENDPGLDPNSAINLLKSTSEHNGQTESNHKASMLVDLEHGRPMELDVVVGEVVRLGRKNGISMPRIETLYALLLIIQDQLLRSYRSRRT
ncbi:hypothetical protein PHLGIDRAFT_30837 [Phlebiopsis gigantea 11061_1 CR5-6]|uniref:Ketopantoate reductase C-terminal domain-containing protein n=1 Tax=Phlebiopsis gigantea (strain 11061_1 CR5-6) TaxID=745531 RepID=A0A0C3S5I7_PHLG1|nr:hypothetical protein PHLGIDRAFT_30837 [Phlebiopsis gigantea 11061_1 CR5-6]